MSIDIPTMAAMRTPLGGEIDGRGRDAYWHLDVDGENCAGCARPVATVLRVDDNGYDRADFVYCWMSVYGLLCEDCIGDVKQVTGDWDPAPLPQLFMYDLDQEFEPPTYAVVSGMPTFGAHAWDVVA